MSDLLTYWPAAQVKKSHRTSKSLRSGSSSISSMRMPTSSSVRARLSPCQLPSFKLSRWLRSNRAGAKNVEVEKYIKNNQCLSMYYMLTTLKTYFFSEFHINFSFFQMNIFCSSINWLPLSLTKGPGSVADPCGRLRAQRHTRPLQRSFQSHFFCLSHFVTFS